MLTRISPPLLIGGGVLMTGLLLAMTVAPGSPALYGFFVVAPAIGLGALGAARAARSEGIFGQASAWLAALGGITVVLVGGYAIATNQFSTSAGLGDDDPLAIPFAVTSIAWMLGSLGVALALVRVRSIPAVGAWLVLAGTGLAMVLGTLLGTIAPGLSPLSAVVFGLGWIVVGWHVREPA